MDTSGIRRAIAVACLALVATSMAPAIASGAEKNDTATTTTRNQDAALDAIVDEATRRYHLPGIAVGVIEDGRIAYHRHPW